MKANPNFTFLKSTVPKQRVALLQGGTRSGKTYSTIYYIIWLCEQYKGLEIDITRDTFTALKSSAWKDFKDILVSCNMYSSSNHNKTDHIYYLNGNIISYYGADSPGNIHGRSRDILWINEAHLFDKETYDQLAARTRGKIIMDYNPALGNEHWLDKFIDKYPPLITTYRDNPHLTRAQVSDIEDKLDDPYWWAVYGNGTRAAREGAIYTKWTTGEFDTSLPYIYGMDFGYTNDPTTLVKVAVDNKTKSIYLEECLYKTNLDTSEIFASILEPRVKHIADSAEPRLIGELSKLRVNIEPCTKGADSIRAGIKKIQGYQLVVCGTSSNLRKELNNYVWKTDGVPIDAENHICDSFRYAVDYLTKPVSYTGVHRRKSI